MIYPFDEIALFVWNEFTAIADMFIGDRPNELGSEQVQDDSPVVVVVHTPEEMMRDTESAKSPVSCVSESLM